MSFPNYVHQNNHHSNQVIDHFLPPAKSHVPPHSQPSTPEGNLCSGFSHHRLISLFLNYI